MAKKQMSPVDMDKEFVKLSDTEKHFMNKIKEMNSSRTTYRSTTQLRSRMVAGALGLGVLSICILFPAYDKMRICIKQLNVQM